MEKIKAKVENMLHKDNTSTTDNTTTGTTSTSTYGNQTATGAPHTSHTANRVDPTVSSGQHTGVTGTHGSDPTGPHDSRLANSADPRVHDHNGSHGNTTTGYGNTHSSTTGNTFGAGTHSQNTHGSDPTGPHDSKLANTLDPRVDSDHAGSYGNTGSARDTTGSGNTHSNTTGNTFGAGTHSNNTYGTDSTGLHGSHHAGQGLGNTNTTSGLGSNTHTTNTHGGYSGSDPRGPHDSHLANVADPRVESDRVGQGYNNTTTGNTFGAGSNTHSTTQSGYSDPSGPHDSRLANKADPRVQDRVGEYGNTTGNTYGAGNTTGNTYGAGNNLPGPADKTAGPHKSNLMNKMDPRVDADLDGSKTMGGDRTYD
ncbi:hypothetical protein P154DRAFT_194908 [Amniculicola lignicola CBS 123094]|uniref:Cell surface protein n=1 Tax=Amniculicola lignicola CBS 123094 TaxID=1392246 RepID=A0A6A5WH61_9PLEO|nr:hypothetical protein P154DRAFT_194908 [Amniculicola lignicola CBS 123094]